MPNSLEHNTVGKMNSGRITSNKWSIFLTAVAASAYFLIGCETFIKIQAWPAPYSIPAGSVVTIHQDLTVKPHEVSVWIQFGEIADRKNIKVRYPNCRFELFTIKPTVQTIYKDQVKIIKFVHTTDYVMNDNIMFASLTNVASDGDPMVEVFTTEIYLKSKKQPDLYRLICEHWEDPATGVFLTMQQIRETLGNIATIQETH